MALQLIREDDSGHYLPEKLITATRKQHIMLYFIVGARRIGKTLFFQRLACRLYMEYGCQTVWMRNKKVELEDDDFAGDFLTGMHELGWCPDGWISDRNGVWTSDDKDAEQVVKFQSLSTFSNRRGNMSPKVLMMVLDEFMPEDRKYPRHCGTGLMSLTKTMISGKTDGRLFCLSNFISAGNPYFVKFKVYADPSRDVTVYPDKGIAIETCRGYRTAILEDNPWNKVYAAGGYQDYAEAEEDSLVQMIRKPPKGCKGAGYVILSDGEYYRAYIKDGLVYWAPYHGSIKDLVVYAATLQEQDLGTYIMPKVLRQDIVNMQESCTMRFREPNTMFAILSLVYDTV